MFSATLTPYHLCNWEWLLLESHGQCDDKPAHFWEEEQHLEDKWQLEFRWKWKSVVCKLLLQKGSNETLPILCCLISVLEQWSNSSIGIRQHEYHYRDTRCQSEPTQLVSHHVCFFSLTLLIFFALYCHGFPKCSAAHIMLFCIMSIIVMSTFDSTIVYKCNDVKCVFHQSSLSDIFLTTFSHICKVFAMLYAAGQK